MLFYSLLVGTAFAGVETATSVVCVGASCDDTCEDKSGCACTTIDLCESGGCDAIESCDAWDVQGSTVDGECHVQSGSGAYKYTCSDTSGGGMSCFSPNSGVETMDGVIPMSDLHAGDIVRVGPNEFSEVVGFIHKDLETASQFLRFNGLFEVSDHHLIETVSGYSHAVDVQVGQELLTVDGAVEVTSIETITRKGYMAPLTKSGTIAVDGFMASNYAHVPANLHWLADLMMFPRKCFTYETESTMDFYSWAMDTVLHPPFKALHGGYSDF